MSVDGAELTADVDDVGLVSADATTELTADVDESDTDLVSADAATELTADVDSVVELMDTSAFGAEPGTLPAPTL